MTSRQPFNQPAGIVILLIAWQVVAFATASSFGAMPDPQVFVQRIQGVLVDVLVTIGARPVSGLTASDFELLDNGVAQTVSVLDPRDVPLNAVLALDISESMTGPPMADVLAASETLLADLRTGDRIALETFNQAVVIRVPLTGDRTHVTGALSRASTGGETSILDGIYVALMTTNDQPGRALVIVCTDGRDTSSWLDEDEVLDAARRSNAVIYALATGGARQWAPLAHVTEATGGETIELASTRDLAARVAALLQEFRTRYVLTYVPHGVADKGFHRLTVRVRRKGAVVKARPGYFGW